ncbi:MAG: PBP1A family penicillin-binding protein [candidate division Zixibacteria bacterium]|nr:PBP1A family penicillin-binding protein [candidate division Zixibacteria bacterium]
MKTRRRILLAFVFIVGPVSAATVAWVGATLWQYEKELPSIEKVYNIKPRLSTRLYDRYDRPFYDFYTERRELVPLANLPPHLIQSLLATEDRDFYQHWGVQWRAIVRAVLVNALEGQRAQGGSTITQQLARQLFLTPEKTLPRKIKEWMMAIKLERIYAKNEILEMYLNHNYFGAGAYGIQAAAQTYFGKKAEDLTLIEGALLIGVLPAPTLYSPMRNPDLAMKRRNTVLRSLLAVGDIDAAACDSLSALPIELHATEAPTQVGDYFAEEIRRYIEKTYGVEALYTEGWSIYTTLDPDIQRVAEQTVRSRLDSLRGVAAARYPANDPVYTYIVRDSVTGRLTRVRKKMQAALMAIDNKTGGVLAMVGGYDYGESQFNRVTQALRQPGSAFKPFVLTAAVEAGFKPSDTILDAPVLIKIPGAPDYNPANFDGKFLGPVTIRFGYRESRNLVAIRLLQKIDPQRAVFYAQRMGITTPLLPVPSLAIGSSEVTLYDLTAAYTTFPNGGIKTVPTLIRKIKDRFGRTVEDHPAPRREEVLSAPTAYTVLDVLKSVIDSGTAASARSRGFWRPAAGKTGTTNEYMDNWFIGFTPQITCGVWVGYDLKTPIGGYHTGTGAATALPIWTDVMKFASRDLTPDDFPTPDGILKIMVCQDSNKRASENCPAIREEVFTNPDDTLEVCPLHDPNARKKAKRVRL